jgi:hypothetical protein
VYLTEQIAGVRWPDGIPRLAATAAQVAPRLLNLDSLIRLHRADENSAADMEAVLDGLRSLARRHRVRDPRRPIWRCTSGWRRSPAGSVRTWSTCRTM